MSESEDVPVVHFDTEPNLRPGPTEQGGGHGGMATREQEEPLYLAPPALTAQGSAV